MCDKLIGKKHELRIIFCTNKILRHLEKKKKFAVEQLELKTKN